jgi:hypothetical protein
MNLRKVIRKEAGLKSPFRGKLVLWHIYKFQKVCQA